MSLKYAEQMKDKKASYIKVKHVERFILAIASFEEKIFEKRQKIRQVYILMLFCYIVFYIYLCSSMHMFPAVSS